LSRPVEWHSFSAFKFLDRSDHRKLGIVKLLDVRIGDATARRNSRVVLGPQWQVLGVDAVDHRLQAFGGQTFEMPVDSGCG